MTYEKFKDSCENTYSVGSYRYTALYLLLLQALNLLNWRFWSSQRHPSTLFDPEHRLTNFLSLFNQGSV